MIGLILLGASVTGDGTTVGRSIGVRSAEAIQFTVPLATPWTTNPVVLDDAPARVGVYVT